MAPEEPRELTTTERLIGMTEPGVMPSPAPAEESAEEPAAEE